MNYFRHFSFSNTQYVIIYLCYNRKLQEYIKINKKYFEKT